MNTKIVGENLRKIRIKKNITQSEISKLTGISNVYLSNLEKGIKKNPSIKILEKIASALNVSVDEFFKEDVQKEDDPDEELSLSEILRGIYNNVPDTELPLAAQIVKKLIDEDLINKDGTIPPKVQKLLLEAISLQSKLEHIKKE